MAVTIAIIPDTQVYSDKDNGIFEDITQWIVDNEDAEDIEMVIHGGDIINNGDSASSEWDVAETAMDKLENNNIPNLVNLGNHDADDIRNPTEYRNRFPASRYSDFQSNVSTITDSGTYNGFTENAYMVQEVDGRKFLYMAVEFGPRDEVVNWMDTVLGNHEDAIQIVSTHHYLTTFGTRMDDDSNFAPTNYGSIGSDNNNGKEMWRKVIRKHDVEFVFSAHDITDNTKRAFRKDYGSSGQRTHQEFVNYQTISNGGDGTFALLTFDSSSKAEVRTYSTLDSSFKTGYEENHFVDISQRKTVREENKNILNTL